MRSKLLLAIPAAVIAGASMFLMSDGKTYTPRPEQKMKSDAMEALQFLTASAAFPNNDIPADGYSKAFAHFNATYASKSATATSAWTSIGPVNIGGRTLSIAINPQDTSEIWLGSASGGLWRSNTGGTGVNAWSYVPTGLPVLGVSTIAMDPNNPDVMYIGTGETYAYGTSTNGLVNRTTRGTHGMGILKTTDGGATWNYSLNWSYQQQRCIWDIVFNPLNTNVLYAATTEGVYKSSDAGATWNPVLNVQMAMDLEIDKTDTNIVYAGVGNLSSPNKGLYKTTNSGASWNILTNGLPVNNHTGRITLAMSPDNSDELFATVANAFSTVGLYRTTDEGQNWTLVSTSDVMSYQGWYSKGMAIKPGSPNEILSAGIDVHYSSASGSGLMPVSNQSSSGPDYVHADIHDVVVNPLDPEKVYILSDGGLFRSDNFGQTYYECTNGYITSQFYIGSVAALDSSIALGGLQDNYSVAYWGSPYWIPVVGGDGCYNAIDPNDPNRQFAAYQYLNIYMTDNMWSDAYQSLSNTASAFGGNTNAFLAPYVMCPSNPNTLYGGSENMVKTTDGGWTWNAVGPMQLDNGNIILSIGVSATNEDSLYCATAPSQNIPMKVFRSIDGGNTYTPISTGLPNRYPRRITVNPHNSKEVYIVFSGFGTGHIFKSTDAGNTWTDISTSLPDMPFHCLAIDPLYPSTIYAGSDLGMFVSQDAGATWTTYNTGFPGTPMVFDIVIPGSIRALYAFTHGNGAFKRDPVNTGVKENSISYGMNIYPNPSNEQTFISFASESNDDITITVYDLTGKLVKNETRDVQKGANNIALSTMEMSIGTYLVAVKQGEKLYSKKLVVTR